MQFLKAGLYCNLGVIFLLMRSQSMSWLIFYNQSNVKKFLRHHVSLPQLTTAIDRGLGVASIKSVKGFSILGSLFSGRSSF